MAQRTEYHREYYRQNIHKRRRQRMESKARCGWRAEEVAAPGCCPDQANDLMRRWFPI